MVSGRGYCGAFLVGSAAIEIAEQIIANAPLSVRVTKMAVDAILSLPAEEAWRRNAEFAQMIEGSEDFVEGSRAFRDGRPPEFKGR